MMTYNPPQGNQGGGGGRSGAGAGAGAAVGGAGGAGKKTGDEVKELGAGEEQHVHIIRKESVKGDAHGSVGFSKIGKALQLVLSPDRLSVTGHKGYRTARVSHGVHSGTWYCELTPTHLGASGHVRMGWCTHKAEMQAPVGFDVYGYGFRDIEGSKIHNGLREAYAPGGGTSFGEGDVIGLLIHLPEGGRPIERRKWTVVRYKGQMYYEDEKEQIPEKLVGSCIHFLVNGVPLGPAFTDLMEGTWYPAVSIFTKPDQVEGATVMANFGPVFRYPPPDIEDVPPPRPMSDLEEAKIEGNKA